MAQTDEDALKVIQAKSEGVLQSDLWKILEVDSRKCSRIVKKLIGILNALGDAYRRAARPRDALDAWRASLSVNPDQQAVRAALEGIEQQLSSGRGSHDRTNSLK